ncbi:MAG: hypothetical protein J4G04_01395 [Nitrosopumilaceae archaeon]|nr:hypothetical protein [Nitrosopumilaceae archaeon]
MRRHRCAKGQGHLQPDTPAVDILGRRLPLREGPGGYEATKQFLAEAKAREEARKDGEAAESAAGGGGEGDGEPPGKAPAKPCGGRPGHPGRSHHAKSDRTILYTADMCTGCGSTDLEMLRPIKKPVADFGKGGEDEGADAKDRHTAIVTLGWCGTCRTVIDPAPHLVWGT